ncbi:FxsB family cyclophane-forming radical SAM/SPASM peptide maturase (plasmid) [Streptomyces sp. BI20]|uniref:FxsB family cyclophane-forming radical SAM/SPASM peptide maturase n=1 Tax=Streptomyces sp. BI20 TaxID=3403460 RepID=UPI003C737266
MSRPPLRPTGPVWPAAPDLAAREAAGWRPVPLHSFVLKVHSRCDLACSHCYVYRAEDSGWRAQPRVMAPGTAARAAERIAEHAGAHGLTEVGLVLHGGEPLLAGEDALAGVVGAVRGALGPGVRLRPVLQTNGTRLTARILDRCGELGVRVGVSLDGGRVAHDRRRRGADGRGSHARVAAGLGLLSAAPYRALFAGLLCTIDLRNDPVRVYEDLLAHRPPVVDLLLPLGTWHRPPPGGDPAGRRTPYADWLIAVFERWYGAPVRETRVRLLEDLMALLLGAGAGTETLGLAPVRYAVVETDGSLGQDDSLRIAYEGAAGTGMDVWRHSFDELVRHPGIAARQWGAEGLAPACRACPLHRVCGGGPYATRYRPASGFANPSVHCADLAALIRHVGARLRADLGPGAPGAELSAGCAGRSSRPRG